MKPHDRKIIISRKELTNALWPYIAKKYAEAETKLKPVLDSLFESDYFKSRVKLKDTVVK